MCGIAGIAGPDAGSQAEAVQKMLAVMGHRGPDGHGIYSSPDGSCLLGHRRLSIIDPSTMSAQPFVLPGFAALSYNGECYNFKDLRHELIQQGVQFVSTGDTEVVLRTLVAAGDKRGLRRLNAMFAMALWDERQNYLLLARDYFGQKPLYFCIASNYLVFASEVRALLASGLVERRLDEDAVRGYLSYGAVQSPNTIVRNVRSLEAGSLLKFQNGKIQIERIHDSLVEASSVEMDKLRELFQAAVARHLISDAPIAIFLSGGLDSSAVVAAASAASTADISTFTLTFPDFPEYSESEAAMLVAQEFNTRHSAVPLLSSDIEALLPRALQSMDQPSIDGLNTYLISKAARDAGFKVALSGLGGDEMFGGYSAFRDVPRMLKIRERVKFLPPSLVSMVRVMDPHGKTMNKLADMAAAPADVVSLYLSRRRIFTSRQVDALLTASLRRRKWSADIPDSRLSRAHELCEEASVEDCITKLEMMLYMEQMLLRDSDVMGMANSLEIRLPFLDLDFARATLSMPASQRIRNAPSKDTFRDMVKPWLPSKIMNLPKKGFVLPFERWLRLALAEKMECALAQASSLSALNLSAFRDIWRRFLFNSAGTDWIRPWSLFVLLHYIEWNELTL